MVQNMAGWFLCESVRVNEDEAAGGRLLVLKVAIGGLEVVMIKMGGFFQDLIFRKS